MWKIYLQGPIFTSLRLRVSMVPNLLIAGMLTIGFGVVGKNLLQVREAIFF